MTVGDGGRDRVKHLLSIAELGARRASTQLLDLTDTCAEVNRRPDPEGAGAARQDRRATLFFEDSTRTRLSASRPRPSGCRPTR